MKKIHEIERMSLPERRRFMKIMGAALAAPAIPSAVRFACNELLMGTAHAQSAALPTYFIEVNLRDQWDHGHVFVAPGLVRASNLRRGEYGRACAVFADPLEIVGLNDGGHGREQYLTDDSRALQPYLSSIAMIDCCELSRGAIHGHESANALRSPGRTYEMKAGYLPMFENERGANHPQGCEEFYSATPTPASLYNHWLKSQDPSTKVGLAFKGIGRSLHTVYHFGAGLPNGELDRVRSRDELFAKFPPSVEDLSILPRREDADAFKAILRRVDPKLLERRQLTEAGRAQHLSNLDEAARLLYSGQQKVVSMPLTSEEQAFWGAGVPNQVSESPRAQIWEQFAWAYKLVSNDLVRSVALEFDYIDVHDSRSEDQVRTQAKQISLPLARLIQKLTEAGLYERTLIAVYTTDGSRAPAANSSGDEGKNTIILAGGMIRGGYYGDIRVAGNDGDGHVYSYHMPDLDTGVAVSTGTTGNGMRVPGASVWRTVMKALGVPDSLQQFPDVRNAKPLDFLLA